LKALKYQPMKRIALLLLGALVVSVVYAKDKAKGKEEEAKLALSIKSFNFNAEGIRYQITESSSDFKVGSASLSLTLNIRNNDKRDIVIKEVKGTVKIYGVDVAEVSESYKLEVKAGQIAELSFNAKDVKSVKEVISKSAKGEVGEVVFDGEVVAEYGKGKRVKTFSKPVRVSLKLGK